MDEQDQGHLENTGVNELIWFVGLWALGVAAVIILGGLIKLAI